MKSKRQKVDVPPTKQKKVERDEEDEENVDDEEVIARKEREFVERPVGAEEREVQDTIEGLFRAAVERPNRRVKPPRDRFANPDALKDYQQQGLGWLLDREGYVSPEQAIFPDWMQGASPGTWTNTLTGVTVTSDAAPVSGYTGRRQQSLGGARDAESAETVINSVYGGILADEMGLGKTVQMISLISAHEAPQAGRALRETKATLVVVPPILLGTWQSELKKWAPNLSVHVHAGDQTPTERRRTYEPLFQNDVVLTTYGIVKNDAEFLRRVKWWRIILDEGHKIKNSTTGAARALFELQARNRWVMSGTPIQNTWRDLFSLLKFLRVRPFGEVQGWYRLIEQPMTATTSPAARYKAEATENLRNLIRVLVMRRTKKTQAGESVETGGDPLLKPGLVIQLSPWAKTHFVEREHRKIKFWKVMDTRLTEYDVENAEAGRDRHSDDDEEDETLETLPYVGEDGNKTYVFVKELVHIPKKTFVPIRLKFKEWEERYYDRLKRKGVGVIREWVESAAGGSDNPLVYLLRLRQAVIHPWLSFPLDELKRLIGNAYRRPNESLEAYRRRLPTAWMPSAKLEYIRNDLQETLDGGRREGEKSLVFSQFVRALDLLELELKLNGWGKQTMDPEKRSRDPNKPLFVRIDGQTKHEEREWVMEQLRTNPRVKLALLSLHATGVGLNLVSANNVYFLDLFFNPQVHAQAIDRTHRIGQDKEVVVKNVVVKDTIEDQLMSLLDYKDRIFEFTLKPFVISKDAIFNLLYRR